MQRDRPVIRLVILAALLLLLASGGKAAAQSCGASATALTFAPYQPLSGATSTSVATVTVTCNPGTLSVLVGYTIRLSTGMSGTYAARTLVAGAARLTYQIYTDTLLTQVWGDTTGGSVQISDGYLLGALGLPITRNYSGYGLIGARQQVPIGSYMDTVSVLVTY